MKGEYGKKLTFDVESVLHLTRGMLLRYEHSVKVPKSRFNKSISWHFSEPVYSQFIFSNAKGTRPESPVSRREQNVPEIEEDLTELFSDFK